jgi:hypothetical protein
LRLESRSVLAHLSQPKTFRLSNCIQSAFFFDWGSGGRISWGQNSTFSWDRNTTFSWDWICSIIFDNFDQEVNFSIMRSKFANNGFKSFDLMNLWLVTSLIMRLKFKKSIIREFQSHDQFVSCKCDHEIKSFYAQMANN